jgi:phosphoglycerate dehydrogenase-like enzyme
MRLLAFEPSPNREFAEQWRIELVALDELLARADYVTLHAPMSAENFHMIREETLAKMKPGSVLINTARGQLVDEPALIAALKSGRLRGAGLDVFEVEPLPADSPLLALPNVLLAGHVAGLDCESQYDTFTMVAETIVDLYQGRWPADRIQNLRGANGWSWDRARHMPDR